MNRLSSAASSSGNSISSGTAPMRKLLRCRRTKAFLTKDGTWTQDIQQALTLSEPTAPEGVADVQRQDLEIYYSFDDCCESEYDFTLSVC